MAVAAVGTLLVNHNSGAAASVSVPSDSATTQLQVAIGGTDFYSLGTFGPPSGAGWTLRQTVDLGANNSKVRIWTRTAPAGAHTVTLAPISDEEVWLTLRRYSGADLTSPVDDVDGATSTTHSHTAPALTLSAETAILGAAMCAVFEGGGDYTPPSGFTELTDGDLTANAASFTVAEDAVAGPGGVGPFTFVYSGTNDDGIGAAIAIKPAASASTTPRKQHYYRQRRGVRL